MTTIRTSGRTFIGVVATMALALSAALLAGPASADEDDFTELLTFETYDRTGLNGQDGWSGTSAATVIADPLNANNQVAEMVGGAQYIRREIPAIEAGETGTVFFRFMRIGSVDTSFGVTNVAEPSDYAHSRAYVNNQNNDVMLVRDGGQFRPVGMWGRDAWQCVWLVADNDNDRVSVYSLGGPYEELTRLPEDTVQDFGFRQSVTGALDRFFWINGANSQGRLLLDDVAVDTTGENLSIPTGNPADCSYAGNENQPLLNPLPDPQLSTLGIEVSELAQLPESQTTPATQDQRLVRHNRITHLDEVPDGSGRLMVPDNNEILYLVDKDTGEYFPYVNVRDEFIEHYHNHAGLGTGLGSATFHPEFAENGLFYTVHTEAGGALQEYVPDFPAFGTTAFHSVVTEWTAADPAANTFEGTRRELMRVPFAGRVHTVQQMDFNRTAGPGDPDYGMLYILVGDGGNGVDNDNPRNPATPQGSIFRVDPLGDDSANGQYGIPQDNPFLDVEGALPETYAVGARDPHRISWDPEGENAMYMANIGEWQVESIYEVQPGDDFGWSVREGPFVAEGRQIYPLPENDSEFGFTYPVAAYDHTRDPGQTGDAGVAVNGGFVYRGEIEELRGKYIFSDLVRGWVYATNVDEMVRNDGDIEDLATIEHLRVFHEGVETSFAELVGDTRVDLRFGSDADGELYLVSKANGKIWTVTGARHVGAESPIVHPELAGHVVAHYDFDHPVDGAATFEADRGISGTEIELINGGVEMRVADPAYPGAGRALQTQQMSPGQASNDDWKAGIYDPDGVDSLSALAGVDATTVMGWFKPTGPNPGQSNSGNPYNAVGLAGVLSRDSNGHGVRALLEVIQVDGELKLVALGRRIDGAGSWTYAADMPWEEILEQGEWVHLAATFDFAQGEMQLFMNGEPLEGSYTASNPWGAGPTSPTDPAGIKIGGSYPQNTSESNPFHGRMDDLMFLDVAVTPEQMAEQFAIFGAGEPAEPQVPQCSFGEPLTDLMEGENWLPRTPEKWEFPGEEIILAEEGDNPGDGIRRPFEYALLDRDVPGSVQFEAEVRLDTPASVNNRDVILVFGHQSDTEYYYAHLSQDNTIYPHNGIYRVNNADRERIDDQWNGEFGAPPAVTDEEYHHVRLVHCAGTGEIAVWVDGHDRPLMTATDTTFDAGRIGFGSFDNTGRMRDLSVWIADAEDDGEQPEEEFGIEVGHEVIERLGTQSGAGSGLEPGTVVQGSMNSSPQIDLGTEVADADGNVAFTWQIPADAELGSHAFTLSAEGYVDQSVTFEVIAQTDGGGDGPGDDGSGDDAAGGDGSGDDGSGGDDAAGGDGRMPATGSEVAWLIAAAVLLVAAGLGVIVWRRRQNSN